MTTPDNVGAYTLWTFPVADGVEPCGRALTRLLTDGGLLQFWLDLRDRETVLKKFDAGQLNTDQPTEVLRGRDWKYLAMYIDDGDPAQLDTMLTGLSGIRTFDVLPTWWRERLNRRLSI